MAQDNEQVEILKLIWTEMKALNTRIDGLRTEMKDSQVEFRGALQGLQRRGTESEVRLATATTQLAADVSDFSGLIRDWREEHRADRNELRARLTRLEEHAGLAPSKH